MTDNPWTTTVPETPSWLTDDIKLLLEVERLPIDQNGMLMLWQKVKDELAKVKEAEMQYRKICTGFLVPGKNEGTNDIPLGNDFTAKVVVKFNYKPKDDNDAIWAGLEKIESLTNDGKGKFVAERLFSWHPSFLKSEYVQLQEDADKGDRFAIEALKIINDELIVITEAAPTLEIKAPKAKK